MIPVIYYFFFFFFWSTWIQTGIENYDVGTLPVVSIHWSQGVPANESEIFKSRQDWFFFFLLFFLGLVCIRKKNLPRVVIQKKKKQKKKERTWNRGRENGQTFNQHNNSGHSFSFFLRKPKERINLCIGLYNINVGNLFWQTKQAPSDNNIFFAVFLISNIKTLTQSIQISPQ